MNMNMNIKMIVIGILAPCCFGSNIASAQQSDPISTDRPSFSTSPLVVGTGIWQLETGYLYQQSNSDSSSHSLPNAHIRFGLSDEVELRMIWAGYSRRESGSSSSTGYSDASIGAKWQLTESDARTQFAFIADISIPIGGDAFSSDSYDPEIALAWAHHGSLDWFGTAAVSQSGGDSNLTNGVGLSFAIDEERVWFVEHEMSIPENGSTAHSLNGGAGFLRGLNTQIDVHASLGLNDQAADWSIGVGWSKRF